MNIVINQCEPYSHRQMMDADLFIQITLDGYFDVIKHRYGNIGEQFPIERIGEIVKDFVYEDTCRGKNVRSGNLQAELSLG